jgi:hypothetical protein
MFYTVRLPNGAHLKNPVYTTLLPSEVEKQVNRLSDAKVDLSDNVIIVTSLGDMFTIAGFLQRVHDGGTIL